MMGAGYISEQGRGGTRVCVCVKLLVCMFVCLKGIQRCSIEDKGSKVSGILRVCATEGGGGRQESCFPSCRVNP